MVLWRYGFAEALLRRYGDAEALQRCLGVAKALLYYNTKALWHSYGVAMAMLSGY